jgi:uncharacterized protein DUF1905
MRVKRFRARVTADSRGRAVIVVPFDPDEEWGAKAVHHVNGTVSGCRVRVTIAPGDGGWAFTLNPRLGLSVGSEVIAELAPEGRSAAILPRTSPQRWRPTRPQGPSLTRWRSSTARPTCVTSMRRPVGQISVPRASPR